MKAVFIEASIELQMGERTDCIFGCHNLPYYLLDGTVIVDFSQTDIKEFSTTERKMLELFFDLPIIVIFKGPPFINTTVFERVDCVSAEYLQETKEVTAFEQEASKLSREIYYLEATDILDAQLIERISNE